MPSVKDVALQWWEERQQRMDWHEKEPDFNFLEGYILRFLGQEELTSLTQRRMDAYFTQLLFEQTYRHPMSGKHVVYGKPMLQSIFDYATAHGLANALPKADLSFRLNIKSKTAPVGYDFEDEVLEQIRYLIQAEAESLTGIALGLAYYAGFNREEILTLRRGHIDFAQSKLHHLDGREVDLEEPLDWMLGTHLLSVTEAADRLLFISKRKTPFAGPSLSHLVKLAKEKHGISQTEIGLNALRNQYILRKLKTISSDELPRFAESLGASPINLVNTFGHFLRAECRDKEAVGAI